MCRQGHTIGGDLSELASIIRLTFDQSRIGVCIDTCHALAAGYDLTTAEGFQTFLDEFKRTIGFEYLVAVHLNDSEGSVMLNLPISFILLINLFAFIFRNIYNSIIFD